MCQTGDATVSFVSAVHIPSGYQSTIGSWQHKENIGSAGKRTDCRVAKNFSNYRLDRRKPGRNPFTGLIRGLCASENSALMRTSARRFCPSPGPQRSTALSQLSEIWLHVQAAVPKQKICREWGRYTVSQLQRRKVFIKTNTSKLVKLQGCCLQARLAHEVCSPHGSFWRMIYSDTVSTKVRPASCWHKQLTRTLILTLTSSLMWCREYVCT